MTAPHRPESARDDLAFVGKAEFYCVCSGGDQSHLLQVVLRRDVNCSDLRSVLARCERCAVTRVLS